MKYYREIKFVDMRLFYEKERNKDFFEVCELIRKETTGYISVSDIAARAINRPAKSFYISDKSHRIIIRRFMRCRNRISPKDNLHSEIYSRYLDLSEKHPDLSVSKIAKMISEQSAPRFYMSVLRARDIYYKMLKKRFI